MIAEVDAVKTTLPPFCFITGTEALPPAKASWPIPAPVCYTTALDAPVAAPSYNIAQA